jgi:hypothetical protein
MQKLLSKQELSELLGCAPTSIPRLQREIGFVRVGLRRVMFHPDDVASYIEKQRQKGRTRKGNGGQE